MSTDKPGTAKEAIPTSAATSDCYQEVYEELLKLADEVGAAYAEAYQQSSAACAETYQRLALDVGRLQANLTDQESPDWQTMLASATSPSDQFATAKDRTLALGGDLTELGRTIGLAYLDAGEKAALAATKAYENIGAGSPVDAVKTTATRHADLARQITEAGTGTVRQLVA